MERQKAEARANWSGSGDAADDKVWFELREQLGATEFLGYDNEKAEGVVYAIVRDGEKVEKAAKGDKVSIVVNQTPFYGESGGQQGDRGLIEGDNCKLKVTDTLKKAEGLFIHICEVVDGEIVLNEAVELIVDDERRTKLRANHSATHLIHEALREIVGEHVVQKGSLVAEDRLRFDFSHNKSISAEDLSQIADMANEIILQNSPVTTRLMAVDDAPIHGEKAGKVYSLELCGGTHVASTGDIGLTQIVSESAVSSGVRRIEALTGQAARHYLQEQDMRMRQVASVLKTTPDQTVTRIEALMDERRKMERELTEARKALALAGPTSGGDNDDSIREINGIKFMGRVVSGVSPRDLKPMADDAKATLGSGVVALIAVGDDGKASVVVGVTDDLKEQKSAVDLVKVGSEALGGKGGGGRADMAQAGGPDGSKANESIEAIAAAI
ncbi:Alanine--tRNA ligase [Nymphon striatum]|nr:Alanine--tRNA ligase [Nymphon striatum]